MLVSGAGGGIGQALVAELMARGAAKVYAAARDVAAVEPLVRQFGERVVAVPLDVTDNAAVARAAERCRDRDILINNAGFNQNMWLLGPTGMEAARAEIEVNYLGTLAMCRAFAPVLTPRQGMIVANKEEIFPDPMSQQVHDQLCADAKAVEHQYATMIPR